VDNNLSVFKDLPDNDPALRDSDYETKPADNGLLKWLEPAKLEANKRISLVKTRPAIQDDCKHKRVAVILGFYNGNEFLRDQIDSILNQSHSNLDIFIADDCSTKEVDIPSLDLCLQRMRRIRLGVRSENVGFSNNFLNALSNVDYPYEYFAFSDQDDIWYEDKIEKALKILENQPSDQPALYCGRTSITNANCRENLGVSPLFSRPPSFANAMVQNIGGGNTMVFNKAARDLIVEFSNNVNNVVSHDWWCYQIMSGAGGFVYYDPEPCLQYRQHSSNLVGCNNNWVSRFTRIKGLLKGEFKNWNDINLSALSKNSSLMTPANQKCLNDFIEARQFGLIKRLYLFKKAGIYRQTFLGNLGLIIGLIINKV